MRGTDHALNRENIRLRDKDGNALGESFPGGCYNGGELVAYNSDELAASVPVPSDWGPWRLDLESLVLYSVRPCHYEVDLERCLTSAEVLDRMAQVAQKSWADNALIAGLIRALCDVLHPQVNLCSFGADMRLDKARVRQQAQDAADVRDEGLRVYPELQARAAGREGP